MPSDDAVTDSKQTGKGKKKVPVYDESLPKALHETFFYRWWLAGFLKLASGKLLSRTERINSYFVLDTLKTTTPLVTKVLLIWLEESYVYHRLTPAEKAAAQFKKPKGIGYGIGVAFALFAMQGGFPSS
jgi:ATP-binding cassette, subfamily C (CFTR/MRP), member 1